MPNFRSIQPNQCKGVFVQVPEHSRVPLNSCVRPTFRIELARLTECSWLKNPPSSYKQPATDIMGGLDGISAAVDNGTFTNEYDFEAAILYLLHSAHDGHLFLNAGATGSFAFYLPLNLTSISADGVSLPKPYSFCEFHP